ncbi:Unknown protein sequence [Pseudomonas coronafaciens pv. oryzae]|nr:Unknown protein sequence [Pseudomonas coronafaciens pv. oryzae]
MTINQRTSPRLNELPMSWRLAARMRGGFTARGQLPLVIAD